MPSDIASIDLSIDTWRFGNRWRINSYCLGWRLPSGDFGLVVDHDPGLQSEYCFEVIGSGREMVTQADESDAVLPDQHPGQSHGAISKVVVTRQSRTPCLCVAVKE